MFILFCIYLSFCKSAYSSLDRAGLGCETLVYDPRTQQATSKTVTFENYLHPSKYSLLSYLFLLANAPLFSSQTSLRLKNVSNPFHTCMWESDLLLIKIGPAILLNKAQRQNPNSHRRYVMGQIYSLEPSNSCFRIP